MRKKGYLLVHFTGEHENGEQVYFSLSEDGLHYFDLNNNKPILSSDLGEKGVRDPFILKSKIDNKYYIIATDLRIANGKGWGVAQYEGSRYLMVSESENLIDWKPFKKVLVGVERAGCVWAPEAIYNKEKEEYMIFFASMIKFDEKDEAKQRIYYVTTKDFSEFSEAKLYIERENHVIDTTIIEEKGIYYRLSKDETTKNIRIDKGTVVDGYDFSDINIPVVNDIKGVEGPIVFKFHDQEKWCILLDRFATDEGYLPIITTNLEKDEYRVLDDSEYDMGESKKRHGSILCIDENEMEALKKHFLD